MWNSTTRSRSRTNFDAFLPNVVSSQDCVAAYEELWIGTNPGIRFIAPENARMPWNGVVRGSLHASPTDPVHAGRSPRQDHSRI